MNYGMVIYILGWILKIESVMLLLPCIVAVIYRESAGISFLITAVTKSSRLYGTVGHIILKRSVHGL